MQKVLLGLIGRDLSHSFSEKYFAKKFQNEPQHGFEYKLFPLASINDLPDFLQRHPTLGGFNVTIPYKEQILPFLKEISPEAEAIKAVNTVVVKPDGNLYGHNTDAGGFAKAITPQLLPTDRSALVLGTGGASKAVIYALRNLGLTVVSASRTPDLGSIGYVELTAEKLGEFDLIVNTTPLGTFPRVEEVPPIPLSGIRPAQLVFDVVYNPSETPLLATAKKNGARTQNGYQMLVNQAEASFAIWNSSFVV